MPDREIVSFRCVRAGEAKLHVRVRRCAPLWVGPQTGLVLRAVPWCAVPRFPSRFPSLCLVSPFWSSASLGQLLVFQRVLLSPW